MPEAVARIDSIWRFPIKSFQGQSVERTSLSESGILGDRVLALRDVATGKMVSGKHAKLGDRVLEFEAAYEHEPVAGEPLPPIRARVDGEEIVASDTATLAARCSEALAVDVEVVASAGDDGGLEAVPSASAGDVYESYWPEVEDHPLAGVTIDLPLPLAAQGTFADLEPLHLLTTASVAKLASLMPDSEIATTRFRPSVLFDTGDAEGFVENDWCGRAATLGEARLELGAPAPRCIMITRPQLGLPRDPGILKTIFRENRLETLGMQMACLGIYAKVTRPGAIAVGDALVLDDA